MVHAVNQINESVFKLHICKYVRMQIFIVCFYVSVMAICFPAVLFVYLYCTEKVVSYIIISKFIYIRNRTLFLSGCRMFVSGKAIIGYPETNMYGGRT